MFASWLTGCLAAYPAYVFGGATLLVGLLGAAWVGSALLRPAAYARSYGEQAGEALAAATATVMLAV